MLIGDPQRVARTRLLSWLGVIGLAFAFGVVLAPSIRDRLRSSAPTDEQPTVPVAGVEAPGALQLLQVDIAAADWQRLADHRERSLAAGIIVQDATAEVPVALRLGDETARGTARLKGDWLDHVDTDQWSLRFDLDRPLGGMRRFSVQHPKTRGYVMEWLVMKTARRLSVLAPRADFVHVAINGRDPVVYYLEEHASKQLLESQGRRDGPIARFDESARWGTWMQYGWHRGEALPAAVEPATTMFRAPAEAYGEGHLGNSRALERRLLRALAQARDLQRIVLADEGRESVMRAREELRALEGRAIEDLFAVDRLGSWLALQGFFNGLHGLAWHQLRFYHDPLLDRLEPVVFDTGALLPMAESELLFSSPEARWFTRSPRVLAAAYRELGRMTDPAWLDGLVAELRSEPALREATRDAPGLDADMILDFVLRRQAERVRSMVAPEHAAAFSARLLGVRDPKGDDARVVEVDAWARTEVSTQLSAFRLQNGRELRPAAFVVGIVGVEDSAAMVPSLPGGAVLLPTDGRRVRLRFPVDERLATLSEIAAIKRAIRATVEPLASGDLDVRALYRPVAEAQDREALLLMRRDRAELRGEVGRPVPPPLDQVLRAHPFLVYDVFDDRLSVPAGSHEVVADMLLPERLVLHLEAGAELSFAPGTVLVAGGLRAEGTAESPVRLFAADASRGFDGVLVLGTAGASRLVHTQFDFAHGIDRGAWQVSGGVTLRAAPVELVDCTVRTDTGEDALNLVGLRFTMERCTIAGGPHDLFDGDFVDGEVRACRFEDSGEDAIDVSGSQVEVVDCRFERIGDKALSVGEGSRLHAVGGHVGKASIVAASKDRSQVLVERLSVDAVEHFLGAAYIKKPEFGAARLELREVVFAPGGAPPCLAQTGCTIVLDGATLPTQDIDVDQLYRDGVLGK